MSYAESCASEIRWLVLHKKLAGGVIALAREAYGLDGELVDGTPTIVVDRSPPAYVFRADTLDTVMRRREPPIGVRYRWKLDFRFETERTKGFVGDSRSHNWSRIDESEAFVKNVVDLVTTVYKVDGDRIPGTEAVSFKYKYDRTDLRIPGESFSHWIRERPLVVKWNLDIRFETKRYLGDDDD